MFEKKLFKTLAVPSAFFAVLSLTIRVLFWVDVTLSDGKGFTGFENFLLSVTFFTFRLLHLDFS